MMRISKLWVIAVLAGTLGVVGCSDDTVDEGGGGAGGSPPPPAACGAGESVDGSYETSEGSVSCDGLGVITVPIDVVLAAKPSGDIDGEVDFDVRVQFILTEDTVDTLGALVQTAVIDEASADVADSEGNDPINVPATVPCSVDFTSGDAITVTTPVAAGAWTAVDGSIVLDATDMTFSIKEPVPLGLSTKDPDPACTWVVIPSITFEAGAGGTGGSGGGAGGGGGTGGAGGG